MNLTVVLGAGFSKAVSDKFPTVDELGELVRLRVPTALAAAPPVFRGGSFERWLSRIAEAQPDLTEADNLGNARDFQLVAEAIHQIMVEIEAEVIKQPAPWWLLRLVGVLHSRMATVISFNYDTLVERAASLTLNPGGVSVNTFSLTDGIPPTPPHADMFGPSFVESLRLLKLHGSVDTYWVPGDAAGTTIVRVTDSFWVPGSGMENPDLNLSRDAPGRVPFIVPPASAKSPFFANPITRQLWRTAAARLRSSDGVAVIGYSVPMTDLVASAMLGDSHRAGGCHFRVINPDPDSVVKHLVEGANIDSTHVSVTAMRCSEYVDQLEERLAADALGKMLTDLTIARPLVMAAAGGTGYAITGWRADRGHLVIELGEPVRDGAAPVSARPSIELAAVLAGASAPTTIAAETGGETAMIIDHFVKPGSGPDAESLWLVPSANRRL